MSSKFLPIQFEDGCLKLLDQRQLPVEEIFIDNHTIEDVHKSIKDMVVRGAPCIGFTAIFGMALWVKSNINFNKDDFNSAADYLNSARPTAVNLSFELENCKELLANCFAKNLDPYVELVKLGNSKIQKSNDDNYQMAKYVQDDINNRLGKKKYRVLTHCNTGFLACGSVGTALGVVEVMNQSNQIEKVWVDETRPYLQGSRLTAYELTKLNIDHEIVVEGCASYLMKNQLVDFIVVGADRIVKNGDTANKVGTSNLAVIANYYNIPFYVVAPTSSFDTNTKSGEEIEIELRPKEEITTIKGIQISPIESKAFNPSFDVTDAELISAISCEKGLIQPPFNQNLERIVLNG